MELISLEQQEVILDTLEQIRTSIMNLISWNAEVDDMNNLLQTPKGLQAVAGNCMLIMAIAEGFRKIDKNTEGQFLAKRPEIPWKQVFGLRNRIAHGYFDIDIDIIDSVIKEDLPPLLEATDYFIDYINNHATFKQ